MGYVECQKDEDAIEFITTWGINCSHKSTNAKTLDKETVAKLGYSRVGLNNI